jgi:hypothetical protein
VVKVIKRDNWIAWIIMRETRNHSNGANLKSDMSRENLLN